MLIDWSKKKTAAQVAKDSRVSSRITISRTQGLIWIFRNTSLRDSDILSHIQKIEDSNLKYEAEKYFEAHIWDSDNVYVQMISSFVGLDSYEKIQLAFKEASII